MTGPGRPAIGPATCAYTDCTNLSRNGRELYCTRHESRATYERYLKGDETNDQATSHP